MEGSQQAEEEVDEGREEPVDGMCTVWEVL